MNAIYKDLIVRSVIGIWAMAMVLVAACLMVDHWIALPQPLVSDSQWAAQLSLTRTDANKQWTVFHFLYSDCPCSQNVLKHVLGRNPVDGCNERIVFVGAESKLIKTVRAKGYEVDCVTPELLKSKYGVESIPLLTIVNAAGTVAYSGGYTQRKQGPVIQDEAIIGQVLNQRAVEGLPLFGCTVSERLRSLLDPLGLKK